MQRRRPVRFLAAVAGGLTTYSSFNYESTRLAQEGASDLAAVNVVVTVVGGLVAGWLGMLTARQVVSAGGWQ